MNPPLCTIIGVGPGLGFALAKRFAQSGFNIAMIARNGESLKAFEIDLNTIYGVEARGFIADVGNKHALNEAIDNAHAAFGNTHVLIYNAAAMRPSLPSVLDIEGLNEDLQVNIVGALTATQKVLPFMKEQKQGTILFTGGGLAFEPIANYASLAIGKAGIRSLAFSLFAELLPFKIHAATVTVCGFIKEGTRFDPELISEAYWKLHSQDPNSFEREIVYN